jgi:hypothetical protein
MNGGINSQQYLLAVAPGHEYRVPVLTTGAAG